MDIHVVVGVLNLLSQESRLINELNNCFEFDQNIFLVDASADFDHFVRNGNQSQSLFTINRGDEVSNAYVESILEIQSKNVFTIVVSESSSIGRNLHLLNRIAVMQDFYQNMKVGMFFSNITSMADVRGHFLWFRKNLIVNAFLAAYPHSEPSLNIFTFHSFGPLRVMNVTTRSSCQEIFPSLDSNYHEHSFRATPPESAVQRLFWTSVLQSMNATFTITGDYRTLYEAFQDGIDVVPVLYTLTRTSHRFRMYPLLMSFPKPLHILASTLIFKRWRQMIS